MKIYLTAFVWGLFGEPHSGACMGPVWSLSGAPRPIFVLTWTIKAPLCILAFANKGHKAYFALIHKGPTVHVSVSGLNGPWGLYGFDKLSGTDINVDDPLFELEKFQIPLCADWHYTGACAHPSFGEIWTKRDKCTPIFSFHNTNIGKCLKLKISVYVTDVR